MPRKFTVNTWSNRNDGSIVRYEIVDEFQPVNPQEPTENEKRLMKAEGDSNHSQYRHPVMVFPVNAQNPSDFQRKLAVEINDWMNARRDAAEVAARLVGLP